MALRLLKSGGGRPHLSRGRSSLDADRSNPPDQRRFWSECLVGIRNLSAVWTTAVPFELSRSRADVSDVPGIRASMHPCLFRVGGSSLSGSHFFKHKDVPAGPANHYGLEKSGNLQERRIANAKEMERLTAWAQTLHLKQRDLLKSDVEGGKAFNAEVAEYNAAVTKATAEQAAIWPELPQKKK